jgi:hypothetical protein
MKIIGYSLNKINIEKKENIKGNLNIQNKLDIIGIEKEDLIIGESPGLKFDFSYEIDYEPKVAHLEINGSVVVLDDKNESKQILNEWKDGKKLSHDFKFVILNFILSKCNIKALQLEADLDLPSHIPFPKVAKAEPKQTENKAKYTG